MPEAEPDNAWRSGRMLTTLFWSGVGLAPLAGLLLLLGRGEGTLRFAGVLAVLSVVLIGLAIALRPDTATVRLQLEESMLEEIDALREEVREDIASSARATHQMVGERVGALQHQVEAVRAERVALPAAPPPPPALAQQAPPPPAAVGQVAPPQAAPPPRSAPPQAAAPPYSAPPQAAAPPYSAPPQAAAPPYSAPPQAAAPPPRSAPPQAAAPPPYRAAAQPPPRQASGPVGQPMRPPVRGSAARPVSGYPPGAAVSGAGRGDRRADYPDPGDRREPYPEDERRDSYGDDARDGYAPGGRRRRADPPPDPDPDPEPEQPRRRGRAVPGGGVYRRTETVQVTTRSTSYVDQHSTDGGRRSPSYEDRYAPAAEPEPEPLDESWTDKKLRERYGRRPRPYESDRADPPWEQDGEREHDRDRGRTEWRPVSASPMSPELLRREPVSPAPEPRQSRSRRWPEEEPSSGDRWTPPRGRELSVGERRGSRHRDEAGTEDRFEERWATVRGDDYSRRDRSDGPRRADEGRGERGGRADYGPARPNYDRPALPAAGSEPSWNDGWDEEPEPAPRARRRRDAEGGTGYQPRLDYELSDERWR